jgi:hypothetical protein
MYIFIHIHLFYFLIIMRSQGVSDSSGAVVDDARNIVRGVDKTRTEIGDRRKERKENLLTIIEKARAKKRQAALEAERLRWENEQLAEILDKAGGGRSIEETAKKLADALKQRDEVLEDSRKFLPIIHIPNKTEEEMTQQDFADAADLQAQKRRALNEQTTMIPTTGTDTQNTGVPLGSASGGDPIEMALHPGSSTTLPDAQVSQSPAIMPPPEQSAIMPPPEQSAVMPPPEQALLPPPEQWTGEPEADEPLSTMSGASGDVNSSVVPNDTGMAEWDEDAFPADDESRQQIDELQARIDEMEEREREREQIKIDDKHQEELHAIENQHIKDIADLKQQQQELLQKVSDHNEEQVNDLENQLEAMRKEMIETQQASAQHQKFTTIEQQAEQTAKIEAMEQEAKISQAHHDKVMQQMAQLRTLNLEMQRDKEMNSMNWTTEERKEAEDREEGLREQIRSLEDQERRRIDKVMFDEAVEQKLLNDPRFSSPSSMSAKEQAEFQTEKTLMKAGIMPDQGGTSSIRPFAPGQSGVSGVSQSGTTTLPEAIKFFQAIHEMLLKDLKAVRKMNEEQIEEAKERIEEEHKK